MTRRALLAIAGGAAALAGFAIAFVDARLARALTAIDPLWVERSRTVLGILDAASGVTLFRFTIGAPLLVAGALVWRWRARPGRMLVFVGATHASTLLTVRLLHVVFGRLRPADAIVDGEIAATFFQGGPSFSSGHTASYFALWFTLAVLSPRVSLLVLPVPLFVMMQRMVSQKHFLGDTLFSIALAAAFTALFSSLLRPRDIAIV